MDSDKFFKISFFLTLIIMGFLLYSNMSTVIPTVTAVKNLEERGFVSSQKDNRESRPGLEKVDIGKILRLIKEDKLSNREAMFYEQIKTDD